MDGSITTEMHQAVRLDYRHYTAKVKLTDAKVAKQLKYAPSVLSQWKAGKYKGDNDAVTRTVNEWIERDAQERKVSLDVDYVPTQVAEEMTALMRLAHASLAMAAIVVPSGAGKTMVMQIQAEKTGGFYLYCHEDLTPKAFISEIAHLVHVPFKGMPTAAILRGVVEKLKGTKRPLFLDEAHRLRRDVFPRIRAIHDQAQVPIFMAGTHEMLAHINDQAGGCGQMASRCMKYNALDAAYNPEDMRANSGRHRPLFSKAEVRKFLEAFKVRIDPDAFELMWALACFPGRGCLRTLKRVVELINKNWSGQTISRKRVWQSMQMVFGLEGKAICDIAQTHAQAMSRAAG